MFAVVKETLNK